MEYIYIAKSAAYPGMVKIGRTDQSATERMQQLSAEDYGPEGFSGDADWEAVTVIRVDDNVRAEELLHDHFDDMRVSDNRELFYCEDIEELSTEAINISGGKEISIIDDPDFADFLSFGMTGGDVGDAIDMPMTVSLLLGIGAYAWYRISPNTFPDTIRNARPAIKLTRSNATGSAANMPLGEGLRSASPDNTSLLSTSWSDFKSASNAASKISISEGCKVRIIRSDTGWVLKTC
jgi:T5orf172 domain